MAQRSYNQICGVARAAELLGERWTLLVVRDLLLGPRRYTDLLAGLPGLSTNVLATRLRQLEEGGVVSRRLVPRPGSGTVYALTAYGRELEPLVIGLGLWGGKTLDPGASGRPEPGLAVLALSRRLGVPRPADPLTVVVDLEELGVFSIVLGGVQDEHDGQPVRGRAPDPDLVLRTDVATLWDLYDGQRSLDELEAAGLVHTVGTAEAHGHLARALAPGGASGTGPPTRAGSAADPTATPVRSTAAPQRT
jgi:DNA-binding HxlR family transcriptional regulator